MNRIPERRRPLFVLAASLAVLLVVAGGVLLVGRLTPTPTPTTLPTSSATASPSADPSTPEGAVRAFFAAFKEARRTDDPALIRPFVTGEQSSAYLSVQGFLLGQKAVKKASVLTVQQLENISVQTTGRLGDRSAGLHGGADTTSASTRVSRWSRPVCWLRAT